MPSAPRRLVWSLANNGQIKLAKFFGADTKIIDDNTEIAFLVEFVRNPKHLKRVESGEAEFATLQLRMNRPQARAIAALLTKTADRMDKAPSVRKRAACMVDG